MFMRAVVTLVGLALCPGPSSAAPPVFGAPQVLNSSATIDAGSDLRPRLAADGNGNWVATWYISNDGDPDILVSRSADDGVTWSPNALLNSEGAADDAADDYPTVATDQAGSWVVVWALDPSGGEDSEIMVSRSTNNGATWSAQAYLDPGAPGSDTSNDYYPYVSTDAAGTWITTWRRDISDADLYFARSTDNGVSWSAPAVVHADLLSDNSALDDSARTAGDGDDHWVMVWYSTNNLGGGIPSSGNIFVARSADDGQSWSAPTYLNSNAPNDTSFEQDAEPSLATDKTGTWITVWYSDSTLGGTIGTDADILFSRSTDNGATWSAAAALNTDAATDSRGDTTPTIVTDGNGRWVVTWTANGQPGFMVSESRDAGLNWSVPQAINASGVDDFGFEFAPTVAVDGDSYVVAWSSDEDLGGLIGSDLDILFAHGIVCPAEPTNGCKQATTGKAPFSLKNSSTDSKDAWSWKWKGDATELSDLLDPVNGDPYLFCLYDSSSGPLRLLESIGLHGSGTCATKRCWQSGTKGVKFMDKTGSSGGTRSASLSAGVTGKAKGAFSAKGINVPMPSLPLTGPVTVQMRNRTTCWTASYTAPFKATSSEGFKDTGD